MGVVDHVEMYCQLQFPLQAFPLRIGGCAHYSFSFLTTALEPWIFVLRPRP